MRATEKQIQPFTFSLVDTFTFHLLFTFTFHRSESLLSLSIFWMFSLSLFWMLSFSILGYFHFPSLECFHFPSSCVTHDSENLTDCLLSLGSWGTGGVKKNRTRCQGLAACSNIMRRYKCLANVLSPTMLRHGNILRMKCLKGVFFAFK